MARAEAGGQAPLAAIILAAGQGKRMRSARPKMLHPLGGVPLVHHSLSLAVSLAADPVVLVVSPESEELCRGVQLSFGSAVRFAVQPEPRGTADAVRCALPALEGFSGTALLLCGDVPNLSPSTVQRLIEQRGSAGAGVAFLSFFPADPAAYGRVVRGPQGEVQAIVEARDAPPQTLAVREVNSGIYAVRSDILIDLLATVRPENTQRELYLTDVVAAAVARGLPVLASEAAEQEVAGVNDRVDLARAERFWRMRRNEELMRAGVTMEDPDSTFVAAGVRLAQDVTLEPSVRLTGHCELASGVRVGMGCVLHDTQVAENARLLPYCVCEGAVIGPEASIGPFARLRPGSVLGARVRIGNFVETKKAVLGEGTKANHLTYLGDAVLGRNVNVGCGTITCNYDGFRKYKTEVGDECLIGSDTQLVAPVTLGPRVVTGAGSVITSDVPEGALAVSRARQRNVPGYLARLRRRYELEGE